MMPFNPLISVIVPIYNVAAYLKPCLDSIIHQTYTQLDIICINDGSTDQSLAIVQTYAQQDKRIRVLDQPNQGLSVARNTGVTAAKGSHVFFVDSDDWLPLNALQSLVEAQKAAPNATVSGAVQVFCEDDQTQHPFFKAKRRRLGMHDLNALTFWHLEPMVWNKLYARFKLEKVPFTPQLVHEDLDFYWRFFSHYPEVVVMAGEVYCYRRRKGSLTQVNQRPEGYFNHYVIIMDHAAQVVREHPWLTYSFYRKGLKYIDELKKKGVDTDGYERAIKQRYAIQNNLTFKMKLWGCGLLAWLSVKLTESSVKLKRAR